MTDEIKLLTGDAGVTEAVQMLRAGRCVALPTETVYGLAADASSVEAVSAIYAAKERPADHPLIVHLASADQLERWAIDIPGVAYQLAAAFWPGPLTLLLKKRPEVPAAVTGGRATIALRVPQHPLFNRVLTESGLGLAAPSANRYKQLSPVTAEQVISGMQGRIAAVLEGGPCEFGLESTIVDLTASAVTILRSGPITRGELEDVLGEPVILPNEHQVAVPGNVAAHYQPRATLRLCDLNQLMGIPDPGISGYLVWSDQAEALLAGAAVSPDGVIRLPENSRAYGQGLYTALHQLDALGVSEIRVEIPPGDDEWAAVQDRLKRAAG